MKAVRRQGFTLIEMMIVVAIISVIAAIAIPNLLRSQQAAHESKAIEYLRAITSTKISFHASNQTFAADFDSLTDDAPPYLSGDFDAPIHGYEYTLDGDASNFSCLAAPEAENGKSFYVDASSVIRFDAAGDASETSVPIGNVGGGRAFPLLRGF
jgi:type IV pilus assembly protein PilA